MRAINSDERQLLEPLLVSAQPLSKDGPNLTTQERRALINSLHSLDVETSCTCHTCISLSFTGQRRALDITTVLSAEVEGGSALILLHIIDGAVRELEIAPTGNLPVSALTNADVLIF